MSHPNVLGFHARIFVIIHPDIKPLLVVYQHAHTHPPTSFRPIPSAIDLMASQTLCQ